MNNLARIQASAIVVLASAIAVFSATPAMGKGADDSHTNEQIAFKSLVSDVTVNGTVGSKTTVGGGSKPAKSDAPDTSSQKISSSGSNPIQPKSSGDTGGGSAGGQGIDISTFEDPYRPVATKSQEFRDYQRAIGDDLSMGIPRMDPATPDEPTPQPAAQEAAAQPQQAEAPKLTRQQRAQIAWTEVRAQMTLTAAAPGVGPDHSVNHLVSETTGKPLDSVVGYPLWFWGIGGDQQAKTVTKKAAGMKVSFSMRPAGLTVNPGDGTSFSCASLGTPWRPGIAPGTKSPTCGYTYTKTGTYTVTMTTHWAVHYEISDGQGAALVGDEVFTGSRSRLLRIGELQVVVVNH